MNDEELKGQLELKKKELLQTFQSNIAAIDLAILVIEKKSIPNTAVSETGKMRDMILFSIEKAPKQFTLGDIEKISKIHFPGKAFSKPGFASSFWKIATREKKLKIISAGGGRRPTIYEKQ